MDLDHGRREGAALKPICHEHTLKTQGKLATNVTNVTNVTERVTEPKAPLRAPAPSRVFRPPLRGEGIIPSGRGGVGLEAQPPIPEIGFSSAREAAREARIERLEAENRQLRVRLAKDRELIGVDREALEPVGMQPTWAASLTAQEWALLVALSLAYPRAVTPGSLADSLPRRDRATDYADKGVNSVVCNIRRKLGKDAIESKQGWRRLGARIVQLMSIPEAEAEERGRAA